MLPRNSDLEAEFSPREGGGEPVSGGLFGSCHQGRIGDIDAKDTAWVRFGATIVVGLTALSLSCGEAPCPHAASGTPLAATNEIVGEQRLQAA